MKTSWTISAAAIILAAATLGSKAEAHGGHSAGSSHSSNHVSSNNGNSTKFATGNKLTALNNHVLNTNKQGTNNLNKSGLNNGKKKLDNGMKFDKLGKKKYWPGKCWWNVGFGYGWYCGWNDYCYDVYPAYCWCDPCYNVCSGYGQPFGMPGIADSSPEPDSTTSHEPAPAAKIVHIENPAETKATLGFSMNGQNYSLEAGKSQDIEIDDGAVVEFDRGSGDQTGRYTLSQGAYRFATTPQGWELFRTSDASAAGTVAAN